MSERGRRWLTLATVGQMGGAEMLAALEGNEAAGGMLRKIGVDEDEFAAWVVGAVAEQLRDRPVTAEILLATVATFFENGIAVALEAVYEALGDVPDLTGGT